MAYFSLALNRELEEDYAGAIEAFQQAIRKDPENDNLYMIASQRLLQANRTEDAFLLLETLLDKQPDNVTARRWLAKLYVGEGNIKKAREELRVAVEDHPPQERIYLEAIQLALMEQDLDEVLYIARTAREYATDPLKCNEILLKVLMNEVNKAQDATSLVDLETEINDTLDQSIQQFPESDIFLLIRARQALRKNQWDQAFDSYQELDTRFFSTEEIRSKILLHALHNSGGGAPVGQRGMQKVLKELRLQEKNSLGYYLLGLLYEISREPDRALEEYEKAVELNPDDTASLRKMAVLTYQLGQSLRASELIQQVLATNPGDPELLLLAGQLAMGSENFIQARRYFEQSLFRISQGESVDDLPLIHAQLAMALLVLGEDPQLAADQMVQAAESPGYLEWIWQYYLREIYLEHNQDEAKSQIMEEEFLYLLEDLSDRLPDNPEIEWLIGRSHIYRNEFDQGVNSFERFIDMANKTAQPEFWLNEDFYFDLAAAYERSGNYEQSVATFEQIIQKNPNHHPSLNYLAYMWAERNENIEQAYTYSTRSLRLDPENGSYLDTLGWIYFRQGKYEASYKMLLKSAEYLPNESVVAEHLGDVMMKLKRPWEAAGYYRIALMLDPGERLPIVERSLEKAENEVTAGVISP